MTRITVIVTFGVTFYGKTFEIFCQSSKIEKKMNVIILKNFSKLHVLN